MSKATLLVCIAAFLGVELLPRLKNAAIGPSYKSLKVGFIGLGSRTQTNETHLQAHTTKSLVAIKRKRELHMAQACRES